MALMMIVFAIFIFSSCKDVSANSIKSEEPDTLVSSGEQQIIEIIASGGYSPRTINAKAGVPTILRMKSDGAFGCERAFWIPQLNIARLLPQNGNTEFDLGIQEKGTKLIGVCSMGMYYFEIFFN